MKRQIMPTGFLLCAIGFSILHSTGAGAVDWNWTKSAPSKNKPLTKRQKVTNVAAVRGAVETPGDIDPDALIIECAQHFEAGEHTEDAVVAAAIHLRVEMAADEHGRQGGIGALAASEHVAQRIDGDAQATVARTARRQPPSPARAAFDPPAGENR